MDSRRIVKEAGNDRNTERFFDCIKAGNVTQLAKMLAKAGTMINQRCLISVHSGVHKSNRPLTPLFYSVMMGQWQVVKFLLENGADPNQESHPTDDDTPALPLQLFLFAMQDGKCATVIERFLLNSLLILFLEKDADFSKSRDITIMSLLCNIAQYIDIVFFIKLIKKMGNAKFAACVNTNPVINPSHKTHVLPPMYQLCNEALPVLVELFIRFGADVYFSHEKHKLPLVLCMKHLELCANKISLKAVPVSFQKIVEGVLERQALVIDVLLKYMGDGVKHHSHVLHEAVIYNNEQVVRHMLACGVDVNEQDENGYTPAHLAAALGHLKLLKYLVEETHCDLSRGAKLIRYTEDEARKEIKRSDKTKEELPRSSLASSNYIVPEDILATPLVITILYMQKEAFSYLYSKLNTDQIKEFKRALAVMFVQMPERAKSFIESLTELKVEELIDTPSVYDCTNSIAYIIARGEGQLAISQIKTADKKKINLPHLLQVAISYSAVSIVEFLLDSYGPELDVKTDGKYICTAIQFFGDATILRLLLDRQAAVYSEEGELSAIHYAVGAGNLEVVELLLEYYPDMLQHKMRGQTPLLAAALSDESQIAIYLLSKGADALVEDGEGRNALFVFVARDNKLLIQQVLSCLPALSLCNRASSASQIPYLSAAYENRNISAFKGLFEAGARDCIFRSNRGLITWLSGERLPAVEEWLSSIIEKKPQNSTSSLPETFELSAASEKGMSGRSYYLSVLNGDADDLLQSKAQQDEKQPPYSPVLFPPSDVSRDQEFVWLGALSSKDSKIVKIAGSQNCYLYLDAERLLDKGCSKEMIGDIYERPRIDGRKIKILSLPKIEFSLSLNGQECTAAIKYEARQHGATGRIFLCSMLDATNRATLLVGFDYSKNGLHQSSDLRDLQTSLAHRGVIELSSVEPFVGIAGQKASI